MATEKIKLDLIDDNPYNPRKHYSPVKVKEMADSLRQVGLRQVPEGRQVDGRVQLAYGHMRLRGYRANLKKGPDSWGEMPVDIKEISDADMFHFAIEENMRRTDITPIEVARCILAYNEAFPDVKDEDIAKKHSMTPANVSNMKRVLRLPEKFLEKIDEGLITFTQGRELLTLEGLPDAEGLMSDALRGINTTGNKTGYGIKPNTVDGLQQSIHDVIRNKFPPVDKGGGSYRWEVLFDTKAAGCLKCEKCFTTHPTKSQVAHYCTDEACWKKKTEEHKEKAAAEAKAKMQAEVVERAIHEVAHGDTVEEELEARVDQRDKALDAEAERIKAKTGEDESPAVLPAEVLTQAPAEMTTIPDEVMEKAKAAAGTRAEVLDLIDICSGQKWNRQMKQGYVLLSREIDHVDEPEECLKRCTKGFHYGFDSQDPEDKNIFVCSDPKCLALKKGAYTRKVNAEGLARKNAERKAVQEAAEGAKNRPRGLLLLIIYTQLHGWHISNYLNTGKRPAERLWDKLFPGTKKSDRKDDALMKKLDKFDEDQLRKLVVEMCFYYLADHGDTGAYRIKTEVPLRLMGVEIDTKLVIAGGKDESNESRDSDAEDSQEETAEA